MVQFYTTEFARIHALLINMYNVRVTEAGGPVSFKVFDAFLVQEKEWKILISFVALIRLFKMNLTVHF